MHIERRNEKEIEEPRIILSDRKYEEQTLLHVE